jgi:hypothetical protein
MAQPSLGGVGAAEVAEGVVLSPDALVAAEDAEVGADLVAHGGELELDVVGDASLEADSRDPVRHFVEAS